MHSNEGAEPIGDWEERSSIAYVLGSLPESDTQRWASKATDLAWVTSITRKGKKKKEIINLAQKGYCFSLLGERSYWEFCKQMNGSESLLQGSFPCSGVVTVLYLVVTSHGVLRKFSPLLLKQSWVLESQKGRKLRCGTFYSGRLRLLRKHPQENWTAQTEEIAQLINCLLHARMRTWVQYLEIRF